eukprot:TRINITY_DN6906_c0_g1_i3.p2 TRINITY_DN6906_c0_g1~~TRINITY_DN6906_c0_g1_i3.p2  ORF type:complete len:155 (-),score=54.03 TRINITY_DN6906_c0_g1_i3:15-479(-)
MPVAVKVMRSAGSAMAMDELRAILRIPPHPAIVTILAVFCGGTLVYENDHDAAAITHRDVLASTLASTLNVTSRMSRLNTPRDSSTPAAIRGSGATPAPLRPGGTSPVPFRVGSLYNYSEAGAVSAVGRVEMPRDGAANTLPTVVLDADRKSVV